MGKSKLKIAVFCAKGLEEFVQPVVDQLSKDHEVKMSNGTSQEEVVMLAKMWADVIWLEWGNEVAITLTRARGILDGKPVILRVHSYEIFANMMNQIRWDVVTHLVCPNKHTLGLVKREVTQDIDWSRIHSWVIPTGIDLGKFKFVPREHGDNIAFVARLNHKKGIPLLGQAIMLQPGYTFHMAGEWQESRFKYYFEHLMDSTNMERALRLHFHGWVDHEMMPIWLTDKQYILCTSPYESQGVGIMEAMAMGIKPLVHNFPGASELYPAECIWSDLDELDEILKNGSYDSQRYRTHIEKNFSLAVTTRQINKLISIAADGPARAKDPGPPLADNQVGMPGAATPGPLPRLACCFMFKNDEKHLERMIRSVQPYFDVIVGMDTGSTDSSNKLLESLGVSVHHPADLDALHTDTINGTQLMFGPARNRLLQYVPDDVDWILMIDSDEEWCLDKDKAFIQRYLSCMPPQYNLVAVNMRDMQGGQVVMDFNSGKLFRKDQVKYRNIVHNEPVTTGPTALWKDPHINHFGYDMTPDELQAKSQRTLGLLQKRITMDPKDWKAHFYKGQALGFFDPTNHDDIIFHTMAYIKHKDEVKDFNLSAYFTLIKALMNKGDTKESWGWILKARELMPDDLDIAMAMVEYGVWTKNANLIAASTDEYMRIFALYEKDPAKKGGRFIYSHNQDGWLFARFYQTSTLIQKASGSIAMLSKELEKEPEQKKKQMQEDLGKVLESAGLKDVYHGQFSGLEITEQKSGDAKQP